MPRWFNTAGPCQADIHYMLSPTKRLPQLMPLIEQRNYFIIHAPRQTGKTTAMLALAAQLTDSGRYTAVMVSVEVGSAFNQDPPTAELAILGVWYQAATDSLPPELHPPPWTSRIHDTIPGQRLRQALGSWSQASSRPLVVFIDEIDSLQDDNLVSVLRQLRDGYPRRPKAFPQSLGLIGLRDVRDYKVASGGSDRLNTASPFNIKVESLTLRNFTQAEVVELYAQHTSDTGQIFTPEALAHAFYLSQGQPWLVNALARQVVEVIVPDPTEVITVEHFDQAKEILIQRRDTHLDSLAERLRESRVRAIIEPMMAGRDLGNVPIEDVEFLLDLGLCRLDETGSLVIANPIYREILPRMLAYITSISLGRVTPNWMTATGALDLDRLLASFLDFWRQHGQPLLQNVAYHEVAPQIVMMAFLHRVVNGGGTLEREYAIGSGRIDLCLRYGQVILGIELKVWRDGEKDPLDKGLQQLDKYLAGLGLDSGWLVIFDQRSGLPPIEDRTTTESATTPSGRTVVVIRG